MPSEAEFREELLDGQDPDANGGQMIQARRISADVLVTCHDGISLPSDSGSKHRIVIWIPAYLG